METAPPVNLKKATRQHINSHRCTDEITKKDPENTFNTLERNVYLDYLHSVHPVVYYNM
jgi:hypothetical protein